MPAPDAPPVADAIAACAAQFSPALGARLAALAHALPAAQARALLALARDISSETYAETCDGLERNWEQVLAHVPGLAPALQLVEDHVLGLRSPCPVCDPPPPTTAV